MSTALETAVVEACAAFHDSQIGEAFHRFSARERSGGPGLGSDQLVKFETNGGAPPITRTLKVLHTHELIGEPLDTSGAEDLLAWLPGATKMVQRLGQLCWQPISREARSAVLDEDNVGPAGSSYLPSRTDEPGPALRFEGLSGSEALASWRAVSKAARETPAYEAARIADRDLNTPAGLAEMSRCRDLVDDQLEGAFASRAMTLSDRLSLHRELITHAYDSAPAEMQAAVRAIRRYNALVNHMLWAVLLAAESRDGLQTVTQVSGPLRQRSDEGYEVVSVTLKDSGWLGHPPSGYQLKLETPLDGLYLLRANFIQFEASTGLMDIEGVHLAGLEQAA